MTHKLLPRIVIMFVWFLAVLYLTGIFYIENEENITCKMMLSNEHISLIALFVRSVSAVFKGSLTCW